MADTVYTPGTIITSEWLNDTNKITYGINNKTNAALGAGLVGFDYLTSYADPNKLGFWLKKLLPKNTVTGSLQAELVNDTAPLNYGNTRAISVIQHRDAANGILNELIPGTVDQFTFTGNGVVNAAAELSQTIWQGKFVFTRKTGDGSGHAFTCGGELGAVGAGGYNELGGYQGQLTNVGSTLGTMSGLEFLLSDSPDNGVTNWNTKMQAVVGRIAKYNNTARKSYHFYASSEGTVATTGILGVNPQGFRQYQRGIDFQDAIFTTGQSVLSPNNTFLGWLTTTGSSPGILGVNNANNTFLATTGPGKSINLTDQTFATRLLVDDNATDSVAIFVAGALKRVSAGAPNSFAPGFRTLICNN
jgi:hypothetical protein